MGNRTLSNKEKRELEIELKKSFNLNDFIGKKDKVEIVEKEKMILLINTKPAFFYSDGSLIPCLNQILINNFLKSIVVDMGAIRFVVSGADIMRPGIVEMSENVGKDEIVCIVDVNHNKPLAIGRTIFSGIEIKQMEKGKVIKNLHWVGDSIWNIFCSVT